MSTMGRGKARIASTTLAKEVPAPWKGKKIALQEQVRVLVADDDVDIRQTLRTVLEDEGYQVDEAPNGKISLELIRAATVPYVVVLDLMMPLLGGAGVLGAISEDERLSLRHAILLVTASTYAIEAALGELLQRLQVPLIRKPFDLDLLVFCVQKAAERIAFDA
jgi:CheY-like chemotaxis protein